MSIQFICRLTQISTDNPLFGTLSFDFGYDQLGWKTSLTYPNGVTTTYSYDKASRLLNMRHLNPLNQILEQIGYTYDKNGNRTAMDRLNVTPKLPTPVTNTSYNEAIQMLSFNDSTMTYNQNTISRTVNFDLKGTEIDIRI